MDNDNYDVVIVGSGIAGSVIAKTLTAAGKKVLMLEAGLEKDIQGGEALSGTKAYKVQTGYLERFYNALAKAPNSPYQPIKCAPAADVMDLKVPAESDPKKGYLVQAGPLPFASDNLIAPGGTTQHWLGTSLRMLPNDFKMKTQYGQGVDWPLTYDELRSYYEMAEFEIGVSGDKDAQLKLPNIGADFFSQGYVFPMKAIPQSYLDKKMLDKTQHLKVTANNREYTIECISTPQGRNSEPNPAYDKKGITWNKSKGKLEFIPAHGATYTPVGSLWDPNVGQRCEGNSSCVPICPVQAKYNALKTLKKAYETKLLTIKAQAVASTVILDDETNSVAGIRYKRYDESDPKSYTTHVATGKIYVLAASAIENAKLLLASNAANSSDQVGRNLMDHLCLLTWGLFPIPVYPFRGPGSTTSITNFRDGDFRSEHAAWICPIDNWGWGWPDFSPGTDVSEAVNQGIFGKKLRAYLNDIISRQVLLHFECEQDPQPENRVTIDPLWKDAIDNYRPVIHYNASNYMLRSFEAAKTVSDQIFTANGIVDKTLYDGQDPDFVHYKGLPYTFRGAGHIVGTHRMGDCKDTSVVDPDQRTWDHDNLFLVGCGNMPTLGTSNPTLTMTALTFKAAEAIIKQLEN